MIMDLGNALYKLAATIVNVEYRSLPAAQYMELHCNIGRNNNGWRGLLGNSTGVVGQNAPL